MKFVTSGRRRKLQSEPDPGRRPLQAARLGLRRQPPDHEGQNKMLQVKHIILICYIGHFRPLFCY